jgi:hypothetical protein
VVEERGWNRPVPPALDTPRLCYSTNVLIRPRKGSREFVTCEIACGSTEDEVLLPSFRVSLQEILQSQ